MTTGYCRLHSLVILAVFFAVTFGYCTQANAQSFSVRFSNREFTGKAGDRFSGKLTVTNSSNSQNSYSITVRDVEQPSDEVVSGSAELSIKKRSLVSSITFSPAYLIIEPGEAGFVDYEVTLSEDPSLEGSYWAAIVVKEEVSEQMIQEKIVEPDNENVMGVGINVVWEHAILVYVTLEGTEIREASFSAIRAESVENNLSIFATLKNLGNTYLRPQFWMEISDVTGQVVYKSEPRIEVFFPLKEREITLPLAPANLTPGEYMVMVIADYGVPQMIAAQLRLTITPESAEAMAKRLAAAAEAERIAAEEAAGVEAEGGDSEGGDAEEESGGAGEGEPEAA